MLRRAPVWLALSVLLLAPACRKKEGEEPEVADAKADKTDKAAPVEQPTPTPTPTPTPEPVAPAGDSGGAGKTDSGGAGSGGGSGGGAPAPRGDLSCDPTDKGDCLEGEQCIGGQGCDAEWSCDADIVCTKGVKEYCGCDGRTFEAVYGNCPWQKYQYPGPCK